MQKKTPSLADVDIFNAIIWCISVIYNVKNLLFVLTYFYLSIKLIDLMEPNLLKRNNSNAEILYTQIRKH